MVEVNCNLCGRDDWRVRFPATMDDRFQNGRVPDVDVFRCTSPGYGHHAQIVQCNHCGLVYANPRWSDEELLAAYTAVEDETYQAERHGRELTFRKHLQEMEKRTGPANGRKLLDVGAYIGVFVEIAAAAGWQAMGVEPSAWAVTAAQKRGLDVIRGTLDNPDLSGQQFDVITWWDVVEHLDNPAAEIRKSFARLKPGGWLVMHTMDVDSLTARLMGRRWPWLMDMHLYYFSRKSLAQMMEQAGFVDVTSAVQGRYLSLGYLMTRLTAWNRWLGWLAAKVVNGLRLNHTEIPVNFGDLFTIYGRKPMSN